VAGGAHACSVNSRQSLTASLRREFSAFSSCVVALMVDDDALSGRHDCVLSTLMPCRRRSEQTPVYVLQNLGVSQRTTLKVDTRSVLTLCQC